jgi:hypothetical protein
MHEQLIAGVQDTTASNHQYSRHGRAFAIRHDPRVVTFAIAAEDDDELAFGSDAGDHYPALPLRQRSAAWPTRGCCRGAMSTISRQQKPKTAPRDSAARTIKGIVMSVALPQRGAKPASPSWHWSVQTADHITSASVRPPYVMHGEANRLTSS